MNFSQWNDHFSVGQVSIIKCCSSILCCCAWFERVNLGPLLSLCCIIDMYNYFVYHVNVPYYEVVNTLDLHLRYLCVIHS